MPIDHKPPSGSTPYSSEYRPYSQENHYDKKRRRTFEAQPQPLRREQDFKKTPLKARNIHPSTSNPNSAPAPTINAKAVAKANYVQQLRTTCVLQTQANLIKHLPALKKLDENPAGIIPADLGFSISYNDKGTLISVVPPDERLKADPQKYNEIKRKLINKLEQVDNQYKGVKKQALFDEATSAEKRLLTCEATLHETGAPTPAVDYRQFAVPLRSMIAPKPDSRPPHSSGTSSTSSHTRGEFTLEQERQGAGIPTDTNRRGGFKLDEADTNRVRFISDEVANDLNSRSESSLRYLRKAYLGFRRADASWLQNIPMSIQQTELNDFERIAYSNSHHKVIKKFRVQLQPRSSRDYLPGDEILVVKDMTTNQHKLVRAGSFDGEDLGGGGYPGYSEVGAKRAFAYLKNKVVDNTMPYKDLQAGSGGNIEAWACGFNSLQVAIFMATGVKVPFPILVDAIEDQIDIQSPQQRKRIRQALCRKRYGFGTIILQSLLGDTDRYKSPPFADAYNGYTLIGTEEGSPTEEGDGHLYNRSDTKVISRSEIENHDFNKASSVIVGQGAYAYGVFRQQLDNGRYQYVVYDPHNFAYETDFFTDPGKGGLKTFNSKHEAFDYISRRKSGRNAAGEFDGFYKFPDIILQDLQKKILKSKGNWERRAID